MFDHAGEADYPVTVAYWQKEIRCTGYYSGPCDGYWGPNSRIGVQAHLKAKWGYTGPADGVWGVNTWMAAQRLAQTDGYNGPVDGVPGPNTWRGLFYAMVSMS